MKSTDGEIVADSSGERPRGAPAGLAAAVMGVLGTLVALLIGLVTFSVQATVAPDHVPLAIGAAEPADAPALAPLVAKVAAQGGGAVAWRTVGSRASAERMLDGKEVYGAVLFSPGPDGLAATVLLSGAVNPSATQMAQPVLEHVADAATRTVRVVTIHPTSVSGRVLPLAAGAMLWLATLITGVLVVVLGPRLRGGRPLGRSARILAVLTGAILGTGGVLGFARLWDANLAVGWEAIAFMALVGVAFGLLQAGVLRWLGLVGVPLLAVFYLMAPAVAGQPPELLNPVYRDLLWSWTPFRFSTEALRSLIFLGPGAPDLRPALWLFGAIAAAGLALVLIPTRRRGNQQREADHPATRRPAQEAARSDAKA